MAITRIETDGDRLLLAAARQGGGWLVLLGAASLAGSAAQVLLPAAAGHAIDAILGRNVTGAGSLTVGSLASPLATCAILVTVIVGCGAATDLAAGVSGATATARLRRLLAGHVVAVGPRLLTSATTNPAAIVNTAASTSGNTDFQAGDTVSRVVAGSADAGTGPASVVLAATAAIPPLGSVIALEIGRAHV